MRLGRRSLPAVAHLILPAAATIAWIVAAELVGGPRAARGRAGGDRLPHCLPAFGSLRHRPLATPSPRAIARPHPIAVARGAAGDRPRAVWAAAILRGDTRTRAT